MARNDMFDYTVGDLGDKYKYPRLPTDDEVDTLERRIARQEANLNAMRVAGESDYIEEIPDSGVSLGQAYQDETGYHMASTKELKESSMPPEEKVEKVLDAEDFRKYIGQIVHDLDSDQYVEVVEIVGNYVAIIRTPYSTMPILMPPNYLHLF